MAKKVTVDQNKCIGCGTCAALCPACFKLGEENKAEVTVEDCDQCDVQEVAASCPVQAISLKTKNR